MRAGNGPKSAKKMLYLKLGRNIIGLNADADAGAVIAHEIPNCFFRGTGLNLRDKMFLEEPTPHVDKKIKFLIFELISLSPSPKQLLSYLVFCDDLIYFIHVKF